jgi:hypothetical protein
MVLPWLQDSLIWRPGAGPGGVVWPDSVHKCGRKFATEASIAAGRRSVPESGGKVT